jgi:hypothetical protein
MKKLLTEEHKKVLDRIQKSIPKEWLDNVTHKEMLAPKNAKLIRDLAEGRDNPDIDMSKITDKEREFAKAVVDSEQIKELEKMIDVEDKVITKKIDDFVEGEIKKAIARGELPKGKKFRNLKKKVCKK